MNYYQLVNYVEAQGIEVIEKKLAGSLKGLYGNKTIWIDSELSLTEKKCVLVEEFNHHYKNYGNILCKKSTNAIKQELLARRSSYEHLVPLDKLLTLKNNCENFYQLAEELEVTEEFLINAIEYYQQKCNAAI